MYSVDVNVDKCKYLVFKIKSVTSNVTPNRARPPTCCKTVWNIRVFDFPKRRAGASERLQSYKRRIVISSSPNVIDVRRVQYSVQVPPANRETVSLRSRARRVTTSAPKKRTWTCSASKSSAIVVVRCCHGRPSFPFRVFAARLLYVQHTCVPLCA